MKLRSQPSDPHARAELIIPWLANGSLPAAAEPDVREHIAACPHCREDYEEQLRVCQAMRADGPLVFAAESSYQKLLARLQSPEDGAAPRAAAPPRAWGASYPFRKSPPAVRWLAAAVILQGFALGLGAWAWHSSSAPAGGRYMTLTSAPRSYDSGPRARVVFSKSLPVGALRTLLRGVGAHIIDGPADGDVYTLGFAPPPVSPAMLAQRIAALRADPAVLFAEPVQQRVP